MRQNVVQDKSFAFALKIIRLCKWLTENKEFVLSRQLLKAGTSIGANVVEAEAAQSRADFISKMAIASKEARETRYWLLLLKQSETVMNINEELFTEVDELIKMLTAIVKTAQNSPKTNSIT